MQNIDSNDKTQAGHPEGVRSAPDMRIEHELQAMREMIAENQKMLRSVRRHIRLSTIMDVIRLLIVVVPLILALLYLPPFLRQAMDYYQQLSGLNASGQGGNAHLDLTELQKMLQSTGLLER